VSARRSPSLLDSFNYATEGIIHVLRTQRNMRIHFAVAFAVIVLALIVNVTKLELIALLLSITFVLIAEMINSAIEGAIDIATTSFDPMAKLAKDIAAGAVLLASVNALAIGYLVFAGKVADRSSDLLDRLREAPAELTRRTPGAEPRSAAGFRRGTRRSRSPAGSPPPTSRALRTASSYRPWR
jgi:diacylglycerol kinase (ATP)